MVTLYREFGDVSTRGSCSRTDKHTVILPARRYASAGTIAMALRLRLSVCLSVTSRCSIETVGRIELVFGTKASFDQAYCEEIQTSAKIRVLPSGTFFLNPRKFRHAYRSSKCTVNFARQRWTLINWTVVNSASTLNRHSLSQMIVKLCLRHDSDSVARVN